MTDADYNRLYRMYTKKLEAAIERVIDHNCYRWPVTEFTSVVRAFDETASRTFLEIGTYFGGTSALIKLMFPEARVVSIDLPDPHTSPFNPHAPSDTGRAFRELRLDVELVRMDAAELMNKTEWYNTFDLVYVDGDHTPAAVLRDLKSAARMLAFPEPVIGKSTILVHDYTDPDDLDRPDWTVGVYEAVQEFLDADFRRSRYYVRRLGGWLVALERTGDLR